MRMDASKSGRYDEVKTVQALRQEEHDQMFKSLAGKWNSALTIDNNNSSNNNSNSDTFSEEEMLTSDASQVSSDILKEDS